jgi:beta-glucanase (GH16 family)
MMAFMSAHMPFAAAWPVAATCTLLALASAASAGRPDPATWKDYQVGPAGFRPAKRLPGGDAYPLSDQANKGKWRRYAPLWDEFDGNRLDATKWWDINPEWKGRQPAAFMPSNVSVYDGKLHLTMKKEEPPAELKAQGYHTYTSAAVQSKTKVLYGYFEVTAKAMASAGSSAFWFYSNTPKEWTEIDVFEIGARAPGFERKDHITVHVFHTPTEKEHWQIGSAWITPWDPADGYHVYGLDWEKDQLSFYVDGVLVRRGPNTHWHQPLTLNLDTETMPDWFGLPRDQDLPSTYSIDYARAWKH